MPAKGLVTLLAICLFPLLLPADEPAGKPPAAKPETKPHQLRRFELSDLGKLVSVSDAQIAPDGRSIVVVVTRSDSAKNRITSDLVLVDVTTGHQRVLTFEREEVDQPRWSPTGDRL